MNTYVGRQMPENGIENGIYFDKENNKIKIFSNNEETFSNNVIQDNSIFGTWQGKLYNEPIYYNGEFHDIEYSEITFIKPIFKRGVISGYIFNYVKHIINNSIDVLNYEYFSLNLKQAPRGEEDFIRFSSSSNNDNAYWKYKINDIIIVNNNLKFLISYNSSNAIDRVASFNKVNDKNIDEIINLYQPQVIGTYRCLNSNIYNELFNEELNNEFNDADIIFDFETDLLYRPHGYYQISLNKDDNWDWLSTESYNITYNKQYNGPTYPIKIELGPNGIILDNINFAVDGSIGDKISFTINGNEYILVKES